MNKKMENTPVRRSRRLNMTAEEKKMAKEAEKARKELFAKKETDWEREQREQKKDAEHKKILAGLDAKFTKQKQITDMLVVIARGGFDKMFSHVQELPEIRQRAQNLCEARGLAYN